MRRAHALGQFRRITVPAHAHPLVRRLFAEMRRERVSVVDMAVRAGVRRETLRNWRHRSMPRLLDLEACFGVLGMRLVAMEEGSIRPRQASEAGR